MKKKPTHNKNDKTTDCRNYNKVSASVKYV